MVKTRIYDNLSRRPFGQQPSKKQLDVLTAYYTLGYNWVVANPGLGHANTIVSYNRPRKQDGEWTGYGCFEFVYTGSKASCLNSLVSVEDIEPLNILQVLRDNGVNVEQEGMQNG